MNPKWQGIFEISLLATRLCAYLSLALSPSLLPTYLSALQIVTIDAKGNNEILGPMPVNLYALSPTILVLCKPIPGW